MQHGEDCTEIGNVRELKPRCRVTSEYMAMLSSVLPVSGTGGITVGNISFVSGELCKKYSCPRTDWAATRGKELLTLECS